MANVSSPKGLMPVKYRDGKPYTGAFSVYNVPATDATAIFKGDPVKGVTDASDGNGVPTVTRAAAGNTIIGVMVGILTYGSRTVLSSDAVNRLASTATYIAVADDPDLMFEMEEDDIGGAMSLGAGGRNADFIAGTGSGGYSGFKLDSSTMAVTNTLGLRIHRPVDRPDNVPGGGTLKWLVSANLHAFRAILGV